MEGLEMVIMDFKGWLKRGKIQAQKVAFLVPNISPQLKVLCVLKKLLESVRIRITIQVFLVNATKTVFRVSLPPRWVVTCIIFTFMQTVSFPSRFQYLVKLIFR